MSAAIALAVAQGVAELVKLGIVAAQSAHEAEEVLVRAMRPTPSGEEVDRYREAMVRLRDAKPGRELWGDPGTLTPEQAEANEEIGRILARDTDPAAPPPPATRLDEDEYP